MTDSVIQKGIRQAIRQEIDIPKEWLPPKIDGAAKKVIDFYLKIDTQWRYTGGHISHKAGLDYKSVFEVARLIGFKTNKLRLALLQKIEKKLIDKEIEELNKDGG